MARGRVVVLLVTGSIGAMVAMAACTSGVDSSAPPIGKGDHLIEDVEASDYGSQAGDAKAGSYDAAFFAALDSSFLYGQAYDSGVALTVCDPPDGSMSAEAGGGDATAAAGDATAAASPSDEGGAGGGAAAATACEPFPASCTSQPDCVCLFGVFQPQLPCPYPHCSVGKSSFSFYCPP